MTPIEKLKSVLCNPDGRCVIEGSDGDRRVAEEALAELEANAEKVEGPVSPYCAINGCAAMDDAALKRLAGPLVAGEVEAVAWRYRGRADGKWHLTDEADRAERRRREGCEVRPLVYADTAKGNGNGN